MRDAIQKQIVLLHMLRFFFHLNLSKINFIYDLYALKKTYMNTRS